MNDCTEKHHAHDHHASTCCGHGHCHDGASEAAAVSYAPVGGSRAVAGGWRTDIRIMQMDCPVEEALLRKKLGGMPAVTALEFNLIQRVLTVTHQPAALASILAAIRTLGFVPEIAEDDGEKSSISVARKPWWPLALAGIAALGAETVHWLGGPLWVEAVPALLAIMLCGLTTYRKGWISIRNGNLNINALMSIAVTGALVLGQWPEAAMVMVLFAIAELIEAKSLDSARHAISSLMNLTPDTARVQQDDGTWQDTAVGDVVLGSRVRVRPGERIGLDGEIVAGRTSIDQAPITGESMPVDKAVGDAVFAGTLNQSGAFDYTVTAVVNTTTLARIIHAVEEAQGAKAPTQRFVDRFSQVYTPVVIAVAVAVAILPPVLGIGGWQEWLYRALVMLVIACPCALVISTPVTIVSGLTAAARKGILIKGGVYLEQGRKLQALALDKTGTLTHGQPVQTDMKVFGTDSERAVQALAASLARHSDHPVSQAIVAAAAELPLQEVEDFEALVGRGIRGMMAGQPHALGSLRFTEETLGCSDDVRQAVAQLERQGKTVILLNDGQQVCGLFAVADTVKNSSRDAIRQLHAQGVRTVMLSGDNPHTASAIAAQVGIDDAHGLQLPQDKLRFVERCSRRGVTGMVGDGINDAPALAAADIGFAMGALGTDTAIETADVALMDDDLRKIPAFIQLSRRTYAVLVQNISLALGIKAAFMALTLAGMGTLWMAVFADVGTSLLVVANGLRLLRSK